MGAIVYRLWSRRSILVFGLMAACTPEQDPAQHAPTDQTTATRNPAPSGTTPATPQRPDPSTIEGVATGINTPPVRRTHSRMMPDGPLTRRDVSHSVHAAFFKGPSTAAPISAPINGPFHRKSGAEQLLHPIVGAHFDQTRGAELKAHLEALPEARRALGASGLTEATFRSALCEEAAINVEYEVDGVTYLARHKTESAIWSTTPTPALYALSDECVAALGQSGGDLEALGDGCAEADRRAHFPEGSACETCLAVDGDHPRCVEAAECAPLEVRMLRSTAQIRPRWFQVHTARSVLCAPDLMADVVVLTPDTPGDRSPIEAFDHDTIEDWCWRLWDEEADAPTLYCASSGHPVGMAFADVVLTRVMSIQAEGEAPLPVYDRIGLVSSLEVDGTTFTTSPLFPASTGVVSSRDWEAGGWHINPNDPRPEIDDPEDLDQTNARDWIAAIALKSASHVPQVPIVVYNKNFCPEDGWIGPDAEGRFFCHEQPLKKNTDYTEADALPFWNYDAGVFSLGGEPETYLAVPHVTLGATGRVDPNIPGGHVPHILGTAPLADPDWEDCAWPDQFVPDELRASDQHHSLGVATQTAQTFRFGHHPQWDLRMVLGTNWRRNFCPDRIPDYLQDED